MSRIITEELVKEKLMEAKTKVIKARKDYKEAQTELESVLRTIILYESIQCQK